MANPSATLAEVGKLLPGFGLRTVTSLGIYKSTNDKMLLNALYGAMIEVTHADLGLADLINSDVVNPTGKRGEAAIMEYESPVPALAKSWDASSSDYVSESVETWNFTVFMDEEIYLKTRLSNLDQAMANQNPAQHAAMMNSASTASTYQMDLALVTQQAHGLFTTGGDTTIKKVVIANRFAPTDAELKKFKQQLLQEIVAFQVQLNDKRRLGLSVDDIRLVVSPEVMTYLIQMFQVYPTLFAESTLKDGGKMIYSIYGVRVMSCYLIGQNISAGVISKKSFDFTGFDFALVLAGGFFYSPIFNWQPIVAYDSTLALGNLYSGFVRSTFINSKGGQWAFNTYDSKGAISGAWFKQVQRFKIAAS